MLTHVHAGARAHKIHKEKKYADPPCLPNIHTHADPPLPPQTHARTCTRPPRRGVHALQRGRHPGRPHPRAGGQQAAAQQDLHPRVLHHLHRPLQHRGHPLHQLHAPQVGGTGVCGRLCVGIRRWSQGMVHGACVEWYVLRGLVRPYEVQRSLACRHVQRPARTRHLARTSPSPHTHPLTHMHVDTCAQSHTHTRARARRQWLSRVSSLLVDKNIDLRRRATEAVESVYMDVDAHTVVHYAQHSTGAEGVGVESLCAQSQGLRRRALPLPPSQVPAAILAREGLHACAWAHASTQAHTQAHICAHCLSHTNTCAHTCARPPLAAGAQAAAGQPYGAKLARGTAGGSAARAAPARAGWQPSWPVRQAPSSRGER